MIKTELFDEINIYNESPLLLIGKQGSGKKTLVSYLSDKYELDMKYISKSISNELILDLYTYTNECLIIFDFNNLRL